MIHNLREEKDKLHRKQDALSQGLSDEALLTLIKQVETEEMICAPIHLKGNVMMQIRMQRRAAKKRQVFTYRAQVLIAMAAALTVLILMPAGGSHIEKISQSWQINREDAELQQKSLEEKGQKRQQEIDAEWTKYQAQQEKNYAKRSLLESINDKLETVEAYLER